MTAARLRLPRRPWEMHRRYRDSFLAFSHRKTVLESPERLDLPFRYPPYRFFALIRKILG